MKNQFKIALLVGVVAVLCGSMFSVTTSTANAQIEKPEGIQLNIGDSKEIKCQFGNVLNDYWCDIPTFQIK